MDISKALTMYEVNNILDESPETLNKKYKKLCKIYHPDVYRDDGTAFKEVKSGLDLLLDLFRQVKILQLLNQQAPEEKLFYITLKELVEIYTNGSIQQSNNQTITKSDLHRHRVYVLASADTLYNQEVKSFTTVNLWNMTDQYKINIELKDKDLSKAKGLDIKILNNNKHAELSCTLTTLVITLEHNIKISLDIVRKLCNE